MSLSEIISNSVKYPLNDYVKFIIIGIFGLLASFSVVLKNFAINDGIIGIIALIISLIFSLILGGYSLDVIKKGIENSNEIPGLKIVSNFINGIKVLILSIIYFIIPIIIVAVLGSVFGVVGANLTSFELSFVVIAIVALILFILFGILEIIAIARFANTNSLKDALNFSEVLSDAKSIGILNIIVFLIVVAIILLIASIIGGIIGLIPYIGIILAVILLSGFITLFYGKAIGLLYANA